MGSIAKTPEVGELDVQLANIFEELRETLTNVNSEVSSATAPGQSPS